MKLKLKLHIPWQWNWNKAGMIPEDIREKMPPHPEEFTKGRKKIWVIYHGWESKYRGPKDAFLGTGWDMKRYGYVDY